MTWVAPPEPPRPGPRRWWIATAVLLLIAAGLVVVGVRGHDSALVDPSASRVAAPSSTSRSASASASASSTAPVAAAARSAPVELRIPAIGLTVAVSALGLNPDRTVQVPTDFQRPGWFQLGPSPGQLGSAVILGHVDSYKGPAVFFRLRALEKGDSVEVALADGVVTHFVVTEVATYPKEAFPAQQVYGSRGYGALQLVTCGGEFDRVARSYRSNVVAYTSLVSITQAPAAPAVAR
jgi:sortase (surface protein transpeptidase)